MPDLPDPARLRPAAPVGGFMIVTGLPQNLPE
jgi:hypothetical protein